MKTYPVLHAESPARGKGINFVFTLPAQKDNRFPSKRGAMPVVLNESKHNVRRLEFSTGLGGIPPNQSTRNRKRKRTRQKTGKFPAAACGGRTWRRLPAGNKALNEGERRPCAKPEFSAACRLTAWRRRQKPCALPAAAGWPGLPEHVRKKEPYKCWKGKR